MTMAILMLVLDFVMIWYNNWCLKTEQNPKWRKFWYFFIIFWMVNVPFDVYELCQKIWG